MNIVLDNKSVNHKGVKFGHVAFFLKYCEMSINEIEIKNNSRHKVKGRVSDLSVSFIDIMYYCHLIHIKYFCDNILEFFSWNRSNSKFDFFPNIMLL